MKKFLAFALAITLIGSSIASFAQDHSSHGSNGQPRSMDSSEMKTMKQEMQKKMSAAKTDEERQLFAKQPSEFDPRKALIAARSAAQGICEARFEAFGCAGQGSKIKPIALEAMIKNYR